MKVTKRDFLTIAAFSVVLIVLIMRVVSMRRPSESLSMKSTELFTKPCRRAGIGLRQKGVA